MITASGAPPVSDTIAAVATGGAPAGIGIVRVSGPDALPIADRLTAGPSSASRQPGHTLRRVTVRDPDTGETLDDVLRAVFRAPRSLTGEDVVELQGHGGPVVLGRVLSAVLRAGARSARPGEFTERAFLNGKMDLAQAEAVADLVSARTLAAQRAARRQAAGALSRTVTKAADAVKEALARIEASIDFPEDVGEIDATAVGAALRRAFFDVTALLDTAAYGRRLTEGVTVVLAGRPNVGKSSLLNALAGAERAIVTPIPGTTRDIVEGALNLGGLPVRALDTAGVRDTDDPVERIGVERARDAIYAADVVVAVVDAGAGLTPADDALLASLAGRPFVVAVNKCDAGDAFAAVEQAAHRTRDAFPAQRAVAVSALSGDGLGALADAVVFAASRGAPPDTTDTAETPLVTSARHEAALRSARTCLGDALSTLGSGMPAELVAVDAHGALSALGEITGETAREEIVAGIFARFCIGK